MPTILNPTEVTSVGFIASDPQLISKSAALGLIYNHEAAKPLLTFLTP